MSAPHEEAAERLREFAEEWSQQVARAQHDPNTIHGMAPRGRAVSLDRTDLRLVLDEYAERGRKIAAFDALVEAVERADLECRKPQTVTGVRRGLHTLTCLEGYDAGMPCPPCALRAALASAKEAVEGSDGG